jgi:hypothetical protein
MSRIIIMLALLVASAAGAGLVSMSSNEAVANSCAASCHAGHNQCRIATKGSPSCDAQLTACLRGCAGKK